TSAREEEHNHPPTPTLVSRRRSWLQRHRPQPRKRSYQANSEPHQPTPRPRSTTAMAAKNGNGKNGHSPENTWAGAGRRGDGKIRVAIVGVGNCASSLVQGRYYYENANDDDFVPGLMHVNLGGYHIKVVEFVAALDIEQNKL